MKLDSLKNTSEFNLVNRAGIKYSCPDFMVICMKDFSQEMLKIFISKAQAKPGVDYSVILASFKAANVYLGLKVSKKIGNAVKRNKVRRRVKTIVREMLKGAGREFLQGAGLIFIPRNNVSEVEFKTLSDELNNAISYFQRKTKFNKKHIHESNP
ncbi:MAG: ribonuclease protein component [Rickettsiaceae bacterium]|jgi:ribonuclease P protein component|nr:ribonuclease protein component [Rickettsiaceae bacterium]